MEAWDEIWKTKEGKLLWLEPDPFVVSFIPLFLKKDVVKVLDMGFGLGRHTILFAKEQFDVYGIETSSNGLEHAREWSKKTNLSLKLLMGEMAHLPFSSNSFDLIVTWNVIYHGTVAYIKKTVKEIKRCLRPDGYLLCTLISTKHNKYGIGEETERNTFVIAEDAEKSHPHHYFDLEEISHFLREFRLLKCDDIEQFYPNCFHWHILAKFTF